MNDTLTGMKQATTPDDILSLLFKSKEGASTDKGSNKRTQVSFQSVLQASIKAIKNKNVKTAQPANSQKKEETVGTVGTHVQAKIAGQNETGTPSEGDAAGISMTDALSDEMSGLGDLQHSDLALMIQTMETVKDKSSKPINLDAISKKTLQREAFPAGLKMAGIKAETGNDLQQVDETEQPSASSGKSSGKEKGAIAVREPVVLTKSAGATLTDIASTESAIVNMSETQPVPEKKASRIESVVAKMIENEAAGLTEETATAIAAQISSVIADFVKSTANKTASQEKETNGAKNIETETLFKAKIADVLTGNGFNKETADRIAGQIKTVTIASASEKTLPDMNIAAKPLFDQLMQKETDSLQATAAQGKSPEGSKVSPVLAEAASRIPTAENAAEKSIPTMDYRGKDAVDMKKDRTSFAVSTGNAAMQNREALAETELSAGLAQEDFLRSNVGQVKQKNYSSETIMNTESVPNLTALQQASESSEPPSAAQPVRAQDIIAQIADLRNAQTDPAGRVKIVLDPPNLGTVEMDIIIRGDRVNAVMTAETSEVRQILQAHADDMKQALSDQGFRIDRIEVKQSEEKGNQQWTGGSHEGNQQQDGGYRQRRERNQQNKFELSDYTAPLSVMA